MEKTKLGISVGLMGAALYFLGLFSSYIVAVLLAGYVLLFEDNAWLKKSAVKAVAVLAIFSFATAVVNLLPNAVNLINDFVAIFGGHFYLSFLSNLVGFVTTALNLLEKLLLLGLGLTALNQGTLPVPFVDGLINKHMD